MVFGVKKRGRISEEGGIPKKCETDVDEEVGATAGDEEDAYWRDWRFVDQYKGLGFLGDGEEAYGRL